MDHKRTLGRRLNQQFVLALGAVALLSLFSFGSVFLVTRVQEKNALLINEAGKRRFLSQRIALESLQLAQATEPTEIASLKKNLKSDINQLTDIHHFLQQHQSTAMIEADRPTSLNSNRNALPYLDALTSEFLASASKFLEKPDHTLGAKNPELTKILELGPGPLLTELNMVVSLYQKEAERQTRQLQMLEWFVLLLMLFLLTLEGFFLFLPMRRALDDCLEELKNTKEELERLRFASSQMPR